MIDNVIISTVVIASILVALYVHPVTTGLSIATLIILLIIGKRRVPWTRK